MHEMIFNWVIILGSANFTYGQMKLKRLDDMMAPIGDWFLVGNVQLDSINNRTFNYKRI